MDEAEEVEVWLSILSFYYSSNRLVYLQFSVYILNWAFPMPLAATLQLSAILQWSSFATRTYEKSDLIAI